MTPIKAPGINKEAFTAFLLPTGSAREKIAGISHLFEHILIADLYRHHKKSRIRGFTTEDYVIIFCPRLPAGQIIEILKRINFPEKRLMFHKKELIEEIKIQSGKEKEAFFRFVWQGTGYEKSPLGTAAEVNTITPAVLDDLRHKILSRDTFFYSKTTGLEIRNGHEKEASLSPFLSTIPWRRETTYHGCGSSRCCSICYFNNNIEVLYLLTRVLKNLNPAKYIQLSEKKMMSALILETGAKLPGKNNIRPLLEETGRQLHIEIIRIKKKTGLRALNELESVYFYGRRWQERIKKLLQTSELELLDLVEKLKSGLK